ncbi:MAG TPA: M14 family zinc carboxypeptidase, partial [Solirubrobacteraceae bacterium]|nr:M14 family zinc carboxypeptidase [Solirubrobacteraceae bacterium]
MTFRLGVAALAISLLLTGATTALAAGPLLEPRTILDGSLAAPAGTYETACHRAFRPGRAGVATRGLDVSGPGALTVKLTGSEGDWDVAVFDAGGRALAADASPDAQEVALGYTAGGRLNVQACRRSGDASSVPASLEFAAVRPGALEEAKANPPRLVSVITPTQAQKDQLLALGLDMAEHGGKESLGVVLHGKADEEALRKAGFRWRLLVNDLPEQGRAQRAADQRFAARVARSDFPSGRDTYRTLAEYNAELRDLAEQNPGLVRLITLPNKTWMGKDVLGIEITENVNRNDGKPAFLNMGLHHAREWPSGEHAMEWGIELINGFKSGDPRATNIVRNSRNIVVPVVNADGFEASRNAVGAPAEGRDESVDDTAYLVAGAPTGGEY